MTPEMVRRFEIRVDRQDALGPVERELRAAVEHQGSGAVTHAVKRVERPPVLDVRLRGAMPAVSAVSQRIAAVDGVRLLRDSVAIARDGARDDLVYPDPDVLLRIGLAGEPASWATVPRDAPAVTVAIVDTGIAIHHLDLEDHLWTGDAGDRRVYGTCVIEGHAADDVVDQDGHGTMLAGTILAAAGRVPAVRLMAVKFFDAATLPAAANAARAIDVAVRQRADILNLSWDIGLGSEALREAIGRACAAGILVVIAAGNEGSDNDRFPSVPACYAAECPARVITVMATDRYDERAAFSNYGADGVDLAAPGVRVTSTRPYLSRAGARRYHRYSGTSAAAAHVTGAAALLRARDPGLSAEALKRRLIESVDRRPRLKCRSGGRLNLARAL